MSSSCHHLPEPRADRPHAATTSTNPFERLVARMALAGQSLRSEGLLSERTRVAPKPPRLRLLRGGADFEARSRG